LKILPENSSLTKICKKRSLRNNVIICRVARWCIFKPKISIWVNFGGPYNWKCSYILWSFGIFYAHLGYFMAILEKMRLFGTFSPVLL
jgi:hypothetical protein